MREEKKKGGRKEEGCDHLPPPFFLSHAYAYNSRLLACLHSIHRLACLRRTYLSPTTAMPISSCWRLSMHLSANRASPSPPPPAHARHRRLLPAAYHFLPAFAPSRTPDRRPTYRMSTPRSNTRALPRPSALNTATNNPLSAYPSCMTHRQPRAQLPAGDASLMGTGVDNSCLCYTGGLFYAPYLGLSLSYLSSIS